MGWTVPHPNSTWSCKMWSYVGKGFAARIGQGSQNETTLDLGWAWSPTTCIFTRERRGGLAPETRGKVMQRQRSSARAKERLRREWWRISGSGAVREWASGKPPACGHVTAAPGVSCEPHPTLWGGPGAEALLLGPRALEQDWPLPGKSNAARRPGADTRLIKVYDKINVWN